jgi:hypothetical protein
MPKRSIFLPRRLTWCYLMLDDCFEIKCCFFHSIEFFSWVVTILSTGDKSWRKQIESYQILLKFLCFKSEEVWKETSRTLEKIERHSRKKHKFKGQSIASRRRFFRFASKKSTSDRNLLEFYRFWSRKRILELLLASQSD